MIQTTSSRRQHSPQHTVFLVQPKLVSETAMRSHCMATYRCRTPPLLFREVDIRCSNDRIRLAQNKGTFACEPLFHTSRCKLATTRPMYPLHSNGKQSRQDARTKSRLTPGVSTPPNTTKKIILRIKTKENRVTRTLRKALEEARRTQPARTRRTPTRP
jgi:hypothetical protein